MGRHIQEIGHGQQAIVGCSYFVRECALFVEIAGCSCRKSVRGEYVACFSHDAVEIP